MVEMIKKFRHFLFGKRFRAMTDHKALEHMMTDQSANAIASKFCATQDQGSEVALDVHGGLLGGGTGAVDAAVRRQREGACDELFRGAAGGRGQAEHVCLDLGVAAGLLHGRAHPPPGEQGKGALAAKYARWAGALKQAINERLWLDDAGMSVQMAEYVCHAVIRHFREFERVEADTRAGRIPTAS